MIKLEEIHRNFRVGEQTVHALDDVNLEINQGEYVSVMGPSGSGKSTLLNLVGLLDHPSAGHYYLNGKDVTDLNEIEEAQTRNKYIGFVFQAFHLVPRLSALENVELPLVLAGIAPDLRRDRVHAALEAMNMMDRAHHKPEQLSGGQRQRVAIARATINEPSVLLADEPTGNLDRKTGERVGELLFTLNHEHGTTLVLVTHDVRLAERCDRIVELDGGKIVNGQR
jgi:putative ABC transport system ATP-binding protein